ncbi:MAG TPA: FAD-binding oxidoreductase [Chloroflexota bacterium]|nr:FAD-binding oxidoreductase [Chloroflexota bacterium]
MTVAHDAPALAEYGIRGAVPGAVVRPGRPEEVASLLQTADEAGQKVVPWGAGTKQQWGNSPTGYDVAVDLTALDQLVEYEPADLVVTVQAGMTLAALQSHLAESGQFLPLDPPHLDRATIGGTLATNASGPSRLLYGTARDFVLGLRVATPQGELVKSGGRVVKNVVGYDLNKLHVGGFGTAGIVVEATFKVQPLPAAQTTVRATFQDLAPAVGLASRVARSNLFPRAVEVARHFAGSEWIVLVWCAGAAGAVERQVRDVDAWARELGASDLSRRDGDQHDQIWSQWAPSFARRDAGPGLAAIKLTCLPSQLAVLLARVPHDAGLLAHAGSGTVYVGLSAPAAAGVRRLAAVAHELGGSAVLEDAPDDLKAQLDSWDPAGLAAATRTDLDLMRAVKAQFDPKSTLNPGRFVAGI